MTTVQVREGVVAGPGGNTWYKIVGGGAATPLVTVHGGPGATHDYLEPLEALADERPVVFYDQLGAGKSDTPVDVSDWHNDRLVDELGRLLDTPRQHIRHRGESDRWPMGPTEHAAWSGWRSGRGPVACRGLRPGSRPPGIGFADDSHRARVVDTTARVA